VKNFAHLLILSSVREADVAGGINTYSPAPLLHYLYRKSGSFTNGALYVDSSFVLFDNIVSNIHAQTCSPSYLLGDKKRIERNPSRFWRQSVRFLTLSNSGLGFVPQPNLQKSII
jgi:hypothetical protein